jgi:raffinose synthase
MTQRMGSYGKDVPFETQFLLVEGSEGSPLSTDVADGIGEPTIYIVFLPLLEGSFRAVLQGNENNELEISLESGKNCRDYEWYKFLLSDICNT